MGEMIEATYLWTVEEFVKVLEAHRRHAVSPILRFGYGLFMIVLGLAGVAMIATDKSASICPIGVVFCGFPVIYFYLIAFGQRHLLRSKFRGAGQSVEPDTKVTLIIDDQRLRKITAGSDETWIWELVTKVVASREGFLIYRNALITWLPYHAFRDEESRERFIQIAETKAPGGLRRK